MKVKWSGLADENYYEYIAKYCLPSWHKLPGEKHIVVDGKYIQHDFLNTVHWKKVGNYDAPFWSIQRERKKTNNFWRKMQSQVWAVRNITDCDFLVLLDTDIEILDFNEARFNDMLDDFAKTDFIWATGQSQRRGHDSGFIVFNMHHPRLEELIDHYENIWDSGDIFKLEKSYDGHAVESMFDLYPSYKIPNIDYGSGFHVYDLGLVHYGSKIPKQLRAESTQSGLEIVKKFTADKKIKMSKHPWVLSGPWKKIKS